MCVGPRTAVNQDGLPAPWSSQRISGSRSVTARTAVATTRPDPSAEYRCAVRRRRVWLVRGAAGEADRVHLGGLAM